MPRRKPPAIADSLLDQLLAGADARTAFDADGLLDQLKKALAERALNAEMDHHLANGEPGDSRNGYGRKTVTTGDAGADKGSDSADFVAELRQACVTPHVAQKARHSAIDGRTTRHPGYAVSQQRRKKFEEPFGRAKTVGGMTQTVLRGLERVRARFTLTMAANNRARLPKLLAA